MGEEIAAPRGLPAQSRAEPLSIDGGEHEVGLTAEMLRRGLRHLMRRRKWM